MTTLYAFGSNPLSLDSRSAATSTTDGITWIALPPQFSEVGFNTTTATDGTNWCTASSFGQIATSNDLTNWAAYDPEYKSWLITKIKYGNGNFVCVGHEKNGSTLAETAFVAASGNGIEATFARTWISRGVGSTLFDLQSGGGTLWFAAGATTDFLTPILLSSSNGVLHWTQYTLPSMIEGLYSVGYDSTSNRIWVGGRGKIATGIWNGNSTTWVINDSITNDEKNKPITKIYSCVINGVSVVIALAGSTVWYSTNSVDWHSVTQFGYVFSDVVQFNSILYFSTWGQLTQFTGFTSSWNPTSTSPMTLVGYNNGVQAYSLLAI